MAKILLTDLFVLNRVQDDGQYAINSYTGEDFEESVQKVIDDNELDTIYANLTGDTMVGVLNINTNSEPFQTDELSLKLDGRAELTQVRFQPDEDSIAHVAMSFEGERDQEIQFENTLSFKKTVNEEDTYVLQLAGQYVYVPNSFRVGTGVGSPEASIEIDGTANFTSATVTITDPTTFDFNTLVPKQYVDETISVVESNIMDLITIDSSQDFLFQNGNGTSYSYYDNFKFTAVAPVNSVTLLGVVEDTAAGQFAYDEEVTYATSGGTGTGLTVRLIVTNPSQDNYLVVGALIVNAGQGYTAGDVVSLNQGELTLAVTQVAEGTVTNADPSLGAISDGEFRWRLIDGSRQENWINIDTLLFSTKDSAGTVRDTDDFIPGKVIDFFEDGNNDNVQLYARYRILETIFGPSLGGESLQFDIAPGETGPVYASQGKGYFLQQDVTTTALSGNGSGLTVDVYNVDINDGHILPDGIAIRTKGRGYEVGDILAVDGGTTPAQITITEVDDTIPEGEEGVIKVMVSYLGNEFDDTDGPLPNPSGSTAYEMYVNDEQLAADPQDGIFVWEYDLGVDERDWNTITNINYAIKDQNNKEFTKFNVPTGAIIDISDQADVNYASYRVTSVQDDTFQYFEQTTQTTKTVPFVKAFVELIQTGAVENDPQSVDGVLFTNQVTIASPIYDELNEVDQQLRGDIDSNKNSIVDIRSDISRLENSISKGLLRYEDVNLGNGFVEPVGGRLYFIGANGSATPYYNDPNNPVESIVLSNTDVESLLSIDWTQGVVETETAIYIDNLSDGTTGKFLIEAINEFAENETGYTQIYVSAINTSLFPARISELQNNAVSTKLFNEGISRTEAFNTFFSQEGGDVRGSFEVTNAGFNTFGVEQKLDTTDITIGSDNFDRQTNINFTGTDLQDFKIRGKNILGFDENTIYSYEDLDMSGGDGEGRAIVNLPTAGIDEDDKAANVEFVKNYVQAVESRETKTIDHSGLPDETNKEALVISTSAGGRSTIRFQAKRVDGDSNSTSGVDLRLANNSSYNTFRILASNQDVMLFMPFNGAHVTCLTNARFNGGLRMQSDLLFNSGFSAGCHGGTNNLLTFYSGDVLYNGGTENNASIATVKFVKDKMAELKAELESMFDFSNLEELQ